VSSPALRWYGAPEWLIRPCSQAPLLTELLTSAPNDKNIGIEYYQK